MKRRHFLRWIGITPGALAVPWDAEAARGKLLSHLLPGDPEELPDRSRYFPALCTECPAACGLRVEVRQGRAIKLEGDPDCPRGRGGLCVRGQASLMRLYHPERLREPMERAPGGEWRAISWDAAYGRIREALGDGGAAETGAGPGAGRRHAWLGGLASGSLADLLEEFGASLGVEILPQLEVFHHGAIRRANAILFGRPEVPAYRLGGPWAPDLLLSIGADLLESFLNPVAQARALAERKRDARWFHIEPGLTLTGCRADRRFVVTPGSEAVLLAYLVREIAPRAARPLPAEITSALPRIAPEEAARRTGLSTEALAEILGALGAARRPLLLCGGTATARGGGLTAALLAGLLQYATGQIGTTIDFSEPENLDRLGTLAALEAIAREREDPGVVFLAGLHSLSPVPALAGWIARAKLRVALTDHLYPPARDCDLLLPLSHALEGSGDAEPARGHHVRFDPVFRPLFDTRSAGDILLDLMEDPRDAREYRDAWWRARGLDPAGPRFARRPSAPAEVAFESGLAGPVLRAALWAAEPGPTLLLAPSARMHDGRSRALALLHEIPDPISTVTYGDHLALPEALCRERGWEDGTEIELSVGPVRLRLPARVQPALPESVCAIAIDQALSGEAVFPAPIDPVTGELARVLGPVTLTATGGRVALPVMSGSMEARGRGILPGDRPHHGPGTGHDDHHEPQQDRTPAHASRSLYPPYEHEPHRWAMAIDLDRCTGCSACVAACYLENNIPIVGPREHGRGREMSWLRVQPYLRRAPDRTGAHAGEGAGGTGTGAGSSAGSGATPGLLFLPMMCQHCSMAPCETVCPVYATYHNQEGLNVQVYNRCVGTRYCANNCPYKARRFNWFAHTRPAPLDRMVNPDVSERPKGVMEKCTFCVQRIREAKDRARDEGRAVADGEVIPACAQSCPAQAIVFGDLLDPGARVSRLAHDPRAYRVLAELGTEPAVYYLSEDAHRAPAGATPSEDDPHES